MNRPRVTRWLRISWTGFWGIACLLLLVLWVRSYWYRDFKIFDLPNNRWVHVISMGGSVSCSFAKSAFNGGLPPGGDYPLNRRLFTEGNGSAKVPSDVQFPLLLSIKPEVNKYDDGVEFLIPYWSLLAAAVATAAVTWIHGRFSLRTLLIAITLIALGLGTIVWLSH
jgi:hypothetical protein